MSDFEQWRTAGAVTPGPGEERLDQLREGDGIDGLDDNEQAAWVLRVIVDYTREPLGWQAGVLVRRAGPECAGPATSVGRLNEAPESQLEQMAGS
ncbi:hypothetical protein GCM10018980_72100 [Streptomyces capoamus]|uniref:Uncharacterized protein n=1 Tax=Streptomyces capoamus TaxID=68183 RepID=A0A919F3B7_9ACTN|nr:hypothetical protein [Streptomyces capoamus]GGW13385.1 hypothetical protein GCM10010501_16740 [Streptomyces libani subsp. rufus]GHG74923.1 hypothetical protein GCM10018980_72100 [Streptomyces capoamus]